MSSFQIFAAGRAGDGTGSHTQILSWVLKDMGAWVFNWKEEVYSNIYTRDSCNAVRAADFPIFAPDDDCDILEAFDEGAFVDVANEGRVPPIMKLKDGGVLIYDSSTRLDEVNAGHEIHIEVAQDLINSKHIRAFGIPMGQLAKEKLGLYVVRNTIAVGVIAELIGIPDAPILARFEKRFGTGTRTYTTNEQALAIGREYAKTEGWTMPEVSASAFTPVPNDERQMLLGNEACAAGSIAAGCRVYAGYPITPASEVLEYMAEKLHLFGGAVIQADSEMAAAHHVIGAAVAGARSMTATSGPGFSLMQEAISASGITETPMVIVLCMRGGPATGLPTRQGQEDLNEAVFGGHGDFARIVVASSTPTDCFYIMEKVFNLAERYQCAVFMLQDQMLAQSSYTIPALDPSGFKIDRGKLLTEQQVAEIYVNGKHFQRYELTPDGISPRVIAGTKGVTNYYTNTNEHTEDGYITEEELVRQQQMDKRFVQRMELIKNDPELPQPRHHGPSDAKVGFIGYGGVYGPILESLPRLDAEGIKAKYLEIQTLWPFPGDEVRAFVESCDTVFVTEYSAGSQLKGLVQREATGPMAKLKPLIRYDGRLMSPNWVVTKVKENL